MFDLNALNAILSARNGIWTLVVLVFVLLFRGWQHVPAIITAWSARRQSIQAAKDADWTRIRDRLKAVEVRHDECERNLHAEREQRIKDISSLRDELAGEKAERMRLERLMLADGEIRQAKAAVQAELRADPDKATEATKAAERVDRIRNGDKGEGK